MKNQKETQQGVKIETLKKGEYFKLPKGKTVYVRDEYNRSTKKYESYRSDDISAIRALKKGTIVITDFEF